MIINRITNLLLAFSKVCLTQKWKTNICKVKFCIFLKFCI